MKKNFFLPVVVGLILFLSSLAVRGEEPCCKYQFSFRQDDIITCAAFSRDGRWLATGTEVGTVMVSDLQSRHEVVLKNPQARDNGVQTLRFSQDGQLLLVGGFGDKNGGGQIKVLRAPDYSTAVSLDVPGESVVDYLDLSPDNKLLISGSSNAVRVWDWQKRQIVWELKLEGVAPLFDGNRTAGRSWQVWNAGSDACRRGKAGSPRSDNRTSRFPGRQRR